MNTYQASIIASSGEGKESGFHCDDNGYHFNPLMKGV